MLESCQSPFTWKADLPFLWVPRYHIVMPSSSLIASSLLSSNHHITSETCLQHIFEHHNMKPWSQIFNINSFNCCLLCMKCQFHFIQSVCMSCCHLELHLFLVTFSNEFLLHGSKITENVVTISSIWRQFRECENCWLWIATALNSFVEVGTPGPRSLATPLFGSNI